MPINDGTNGFDLGEIISQRGQNRARDLDTLDLMQAGNVGVKPDRCISQPLEEQRFRHMGIAVVVQQNCRQHNRRVSRGMPRQQLLRKRIRHRNMNLIGAHPPIRLTSDVDLIVDGHNHRQEDRKTGRLSLVILKFPPF